MTAKKPGVYRILCLENYTFYIGSSDDLQRRLNTHKRDLSKNRHYNVRLQNTYNKYGSDSFIFTVLQYTDNYLHEEQLLIDKYLSEENCCNVAIDVSHGMKGRKHSEESKAKISESNKGIQAGEKNPNYGRAITAAHKASISKAQKGKNLSEETKAKISKAKKGKSHSEETKAKMSEAQSGENNPSAKLTWPIVRDIRTRLSNKEKQKDLAKEFCVSISLISEIKNNKVWQTII